MPTLSTLLFPLFVGAAVLPQSQSPLQKSHDATSTGYRIPSVYESTVMARRMLRLERSGTLSTIFPSSDSTPDPLDLHSADLHTTENRPSDVASQPFGLPEYIADCEPDTGNPSILQIDIANTFKNAAAGSNVTLSVSWHPPGKLEGEYSGAMMPRFALVGWLQEMDLTEKEAKGIKKCWMKKHPDTIWTPGGDIHESRWVRLVAEEMYWFGGFGDRAKIQWIGMGEWRGVKEEEIEGMALPGERGGGPTWPEWGHP